MSRSFGHVSVDRREGRDSKEERGSRGQMERVQSHVLTFASLVGKGELG